MGNEHDQDITTGELSCADGSAPRPLILMSIHGGDVVILMEWAPETRVRTDWFVTVAVRDRLND